ncbi:MAG: NAD(P)/FAD-dependent oxidoreductase [Bacteroidia bacterium]
MQDNKQFDIVICGAGPAGSTCALALGRSGLRVSLIEKSTFPRDKICGDALAAYVPKVLNTIDPDLVKAFENFTDKEKVNTIRIVAPNQSYLDVKTKEYGHISARLRFDNFLFEEVQKLTNVTILQNTAINDVTIEDRGVTIFLDNGTKIESQLIIGCDGAQGIVAKKLTDTKIDLNHNSGAVRAYYKNVSGMEPLTFELHFLQDILPGYFWIFPLPDNQCNVGIGLLSKTISEKKVNLKAKLTEVINEVPYIKERFKNAEMISEIKGFGLPLGSRKVQMSGNRFMLCGDAASLIDPATGEGIGQAMVSGRYAGWHAMECFKKNDFSGAFMKEYDNLVYAKLWKDHKRRYTIQKLINGRPKLVNSIVRIANNNKFVRSIVEKILW